MKRRKLSQNEWLEKGNSETHEGAAWIEETQNRAWYDSGRMNSYCQNDAERYDEKGGFSPDDRLGTLKRVPNPPALFKHHRLDLVQTGRPLNLTKWKYFRQKWVGRLNFIRRLPRNDYKELLTRVHLFALGFDYSRVRPEDLDVVEQAILPYRVWHQWFITLRPTFNKRAQTNKVLKGIPQLGTKKRPKGVRAFIPHRMEIPVFYDRVTETLKWPTDSTSKTNTTLYKFLFNFGKDDGYLEFIEMGRGSFAGMLTQHIREFIRLKRDACNLLPLCNDLLDAATPGCATRTRVYHITGSGMKQWTYGKSVKAGKKECISVFGHDTHKYLKARSVFFDPWLSQQNRIRTVKSNSDLLKSQTRVQKTNVDKFLADGIAHFSGIITGTPPPKTAWSGTHQFSKLGLLLAVTSGIRLIELLKWSDFETLTEEGAVKYKRAFERFGKNKGWDLATMLVQHGAAKKSSLMLDDPRKCATKAATVIIKPLLGGISAKEWCFLHSTVFVPGIQTALKKVVGIVGVKISNLQKDPEYKDDIRYGISAIECSCIFALTMQKELTKLFKVYIPELTPSTVSFKTLRCLYANVCYTTYGKQKNIAPQSFISTILGHTEGDTETTKFYSTINVC